MAEKTALVLGATGLVGRALLQELIHTPEYRRVKVLTRRPIADREKYPKLDVIELPDFQQMQSISGELGADDVYCALGTTMKKAGSKAAFYTVDFTYPFALAQLALQQGAQHFLIVTASGANVSSRIFYNRVKGEIEMALQGLDFPRLTILRPSLLLGERQEFRLGESLAQGVGGLLRWLLPARIKPIAAETVAQALVVLSADTHPGTRFVESEEIGELGQGRFC